MADYSIDANVPEMASPPPNTENPSESSSSSAILEPTATETASVHLDATFLKEKISKIETTLATKRQEIDELCQSLIEHVRLLETAEAIFEAAGKLEVDPSSSIVAAAATYNIDNKTGVMMRYPAAITLHVSIQVEGKVPRSTHSFDLSAATSPTLPELRNAIVSAGSVNRTLQRMTLWQDDHLERFVKDLDHVTFRLQEDGHMAAMNVTPTNITRQCAFPDMEYKAWFYRNVQRGKMTRYDVQVSIVV
ncbi:hypothetical protein A1O1_01894 [Capronia coronata CBS 617.96]|uniref:Uncharacterized protein n=1 Tax=Capronia coronata CBS 617.96 TaxID=1182541 RepID=W9YKS3_9EURO|nr:uncharacterized protein A1O1_01894 [Capronia coronata CBS 617.96]EXJ93502.1 hypothetical protein A1O1_01894 [Capronia coronata CBS 617.96]